MDDYDIEEAFASIEEEMIKSMMRNMKRHRVEEVTEKMEWTMWQAEQLKALEQYKRANKASFKKQFTYINKTTGELIHQARKQGNMDQEIEILEALKKGFRAPRKRNKSVETVGEFFKLNDRKLNALVKATQDDLQKAEHAMLRMANDQYRKIIYSAQVYANTGAATYEKAVDMATKDFLTAGINCIEYKNGARVGIAAYAKMALNTANKRAYLTGEGEKRKEWGITTVIMNKRGAACPKCLPFVGKIFIDDVWSAGKASDGDYPLLSSAIEKGLYHPNCKDSHTTFFEGITTPPKAMKKDDIDRVRNKYREEQRVKYAERMVQKFETLKECSLDSDNFVRYETKRKVWKDKLEELVLRSKGNAKKVRITDIAINKIKEVELDGYTKEEMILLKEKHKELLRISNEKNESNEVLSMFSTSMEDSIVILGEETRVPVSQNADARTFMLKAQEDSVIWAHNHPKGSTFSYADIGSFLNSKVKTMTIVTNKGKNYCLNKKKDFNITGLYDKIKEIRDVNKNDVNYQEKCAADILKIIERYGVQYVR